MTKITEGIYVLKEDIVSIQDECVRTCGGSPSDTFPVDEWVGSVMTMKNGRKIFVRAKTPAEIMELLK